MYIRGMKPRSPKRTLVLTCHEAEGLRRLLLHILDLKVEQQDMSMPMTARIFDKIQDIHGISHYDSKERERQGYRVRPGSPPPSPPAPPPPNDPEDVWGDIL